MAHLLDEPFPHGLYSPEEASVIRYARLATRMQPIDDATYGALEQYFERQQIMDLCLTVGLSNMVNRFHATFLTDVDERTLAQIESGNAEPGVCPIPLPPTPTGKSIT